MSPASSPAALPLALSEHIGYLAIVLGNRAHALFRDEIAALGLRPQDFDFLATVGEREALSQRELAAILGLAPARIVATTDAMQERGLVTRRVASHDRRRNEIALTPQGRIVLKQARAIAIDVESRLVERLDTDDRAALRSLLQRTLDLS